MKNMTAREFAKKLESWPEGEYELTRYGKPYCWITVRREKPEPTVSEVERVAGTAALQECVDREVPTLELPEVTLRHGGPGTFDFKVTAIDKGDETPGSSSITVEPAKSLIVHPSVAANTVEMVYETAAEKQARLLALGRSKARVEPAPEPDPAFSDPGGCGSDGPGGPRVESEDSTAGAESTEPAVPPAEFRTWGPERRRRWIMENWSDLPNDETLSDFVSERLATMGFR